MDHAGDRRPRARADVRRGPRDRAGRRQAAEERRRDVGDALRDQLDVRVVTIAAIRSATTADISDSIAPSIATVSAGRMQRRDRVPRRTPESAAPASPPGMPPNRVPIVSTSRPQRHDRGGAADERDDVPGTRRHERGAAR